MQVKAGKSINTLRTRNVNIKTRIFAVSKIEEEKRFI